VSDLIERLGAMHSHRGDGVPTQYVNPDGPAAIAHISALEAENLRLRYVVEKCRAQFGFYADEHRKAGKDEKAATNQAFADICADALTQQGAE